MVTGMVDMNARERLARGAWFLGAMLGVTIAGIIWDDMALFSLLVNGIVWLAWFIHKSSAMRELDLDTESLSITTKEDDMKK